MRNERAENILILVMLMYSRSAGVSLLDIQEEFQVSRRTAERMRDSVLRLYSNIESYDTPEKIRRWKLKSNIGYLISFNSEELAELENARKRFESEGLSEKAEIIRNIITKVKTLSNKSLSTIETDVEALLEAEGYAIRQYPRFKSDKNTLEIIREAIKAYKKLKFYYMPKDREKIEYIAHPYGLLYGEKNYLVAYSEKKQSIRLFILSNIENISIVDEYFDKDEQFSLEEYSKNSFGIYQEKPYSVKLKFNKEIAQEVKNFHFHPSQKIAENDDKSVIVEFIASGSLAICWHLFRWGKYVEIIEPDEIKEIYTKLLQEATDNLLST